MNSELVVLSLKKLDSEDLNIVKFTEFMGLNCRIVFLQDSQDNFIPISKSLKDSNDLFIAVNCETLYFAFQQTKDVDELKNTFFDKISYLFIYNFYPGKSSNFVLPLITNQAIKAVSNFQNNEFNYSVSDDFKEITRELAGITFGPINHSIDFVFKPAIKYKEENIENIISINNECFFISLAENNCKIFLVATSKIIDIDSHIEKSDHLKNYFSQFIPLMMFFKHVFKEVCWHTDNLYANFIIDDPTLKKNYGYLNYTKLINCMHKHNFASTIAFIPWNYKRTDKNIAKLFLNENDKLSICIHGCNHTQAEFATTDKDKLNAIIQLATKRMFTHQILTGIDFEKVFVFPQGHFSLAAMRMLKINNFLAAVNSTAYTVDSSYLKISDVLDVAIMGNENFPLFTRRYPSAEIIDFAIDAFLRKPLLIVEHHGFFKDGYLKIGKLVKQLNSISSKIKWKSLNDILKTTYLERKGISGEIYCKIYSSKVIITNKYDMNKNYILQKKETLNVPIIGVFVNNNRAKYHINNEVLEICFELQPKEMVTVKIVYECNVKSLKSKKRILRDIKIYCRRNMAEIRDNYICKNDFLYDLANKIRGILHL
ncbi:hypothetical protein C6A37_01605 [Desulfobacteraceae bacterium SEEP-SAG9]|nr:hypothetical protein C6A37_01605 [Desulfobacteraceae bacterium SEEP-SAG9]